MELEVSVAEDEVEAFDLLLRLMYGAKVPEEAAGDAVLLAKAYMAADMYCIPRCSDVLAAALCSLPAEDLDLDAVRALCSLPEGRAHLQPLMAKCVVQVYGNVPATVSCDKLRQQFCSLPYDAVLAWLKADNLTVHSENCVVFLLSAWVASTHHSNPVEQEELARHVRVPHLSPLYLHCVLPKLTWFKAPDILEALPLLAFMKMYPDAEVPDLPPAWQAVPRTHSGMPSNLTLEWEIGDDELQQLDSGGNIMSDTKLYINGTYADLMANKRGSDKVTLGLYLRHVPELMWPVLGEEACQGAFSSRAAVFDIKEAGGWEARHELTPHAAALDVGLGSGDILDRAAETAGSNASRAGSCSNNSGMHELLTAVLVEGKLSVRATGIIVR